jgi:hypothetical protein
VGASDAPVAVAATAVVAAGVVVGTGARGAICTRGFAHPPPSAAAAEAYSTVVVGHTAAGCSPPKEEGGGGSEPTHAALEEAVAAVAAWGYAKGPGAAPGRVGAELVEEVTVVWAKAAADVVGGCAPAPAAGALPAKPMFVAE